MNLDINQKNLYLLLPSKVAWMTEMLMEDNTIELVDAGKRIHSSPTYKKFEIESTKMWHLGPVSLYQDMTRK